MEIADLLSPDAVVAHLKAANKKQVLQEMAHRAGQITRLPDRRIFETLLEREKLGSTGMGQGIAIPHGRVPGIQKMTGLPAGNVGLRERGLIREGYFADITIFDPKTVIDRATFEDPNQYPVGINYVIVNGQLEVDNGKRTPALAGRALRGPGYKGNR